MVLALGVFATSACTLRLTRTCSPLERSTAFPRVLLHTSFRTVSAAGSSGISHSGMAPPFSSGSGLERLSSAHKKTSVVQQMYAEGTYLRGDIDMTKNPERRDRLGDAAIEVLASEGSRGLTHRAVDQRAGLPTGTTANYYRSRESLLTAAAERINTRRW